MSDLARHDCLLCIDGNQPDGLLPILGPVYRICPNAYLCPCCGGAGVFPATFARLGHLAAFLAAQGLTADLCHTCLGVVDVYRPHPPPTTTTEEGNHDHR